MTEKAQKNQKQESKPKQKQVCQNCKKLQEQIDALTKERDDFKDRFMRSYADFENYKRRNADLGIKAFEDGAFQTIKALLPSLDALDKAIEIAQGDMKKGLQSVEENIKKTFAVLGVSEIEAKGQPFDPNLHEAIMAVENDEMDGLVVDVFQKGYKSKSKVIRHTVCSVGKKK